METNRWRAAVESCIDYLWRHCALVQHFRCVSEWTYIYTFIVSGLADGNYA